MATYDEVFRAMIRRDVSSVRSLLQATPELIFVYEAGNGFTLLHHAALPWPDSDGPEMISVLLEFGADINATARDEGVSNVTPLHLAASRYRLESLELLLRQGANIEARRDDGKTALHLSARNFVPETESMDTTEILLKFGADPNARDNQGNTPLHTARCLGPIRAMVAYGADVNATNDQRQTFLHDMYHIVMPGDGEQGIADADFITHCGADVNLQDLAGRTPLHQAVAEWDYPGNYATMLLDAGANVNAVDNEGSTPLHWAAAAHSLGSIRVLLKRGALLNVHDKQGRTPLFRATEGPYPGTDERMLNSKDGYVVTGKKVIRLLEKVGARLT
jgi:ankyrin repeat protein